MMQDSLAIPTIRSRELDVDGNGTLDRGEISELGEAMMGQSMSEEQLDVAMSIMDADGNGAVDFDEFLQWWMENVKTEENKETPPAIEAAASGSSPNDSKI